MPPQTLEEQIAHSLKFLWSQIMDTKTIGETIRVLLIERGVFSDTEYLTKYEEVQQKLQNDLNATASERVADAAQLSGSRKLNSSARDNLDAQ